MALTMVNSVTVRSALTRQFEDHVRLLAEHASEKGEAWKWTGHQVLFGDTRTLHFAYEAPDFAALSQLGTVEDLWKRAAGPVRGAELFDRTNECIEAAEHTISIDRPDLSYLPDEQDRTAHPFAVVTTARVRPGHSEACEELIRKLAEAIPKVDDPTRLIAYQSMIGDMHLYWTVRPLRGLEALDDATPPADLLTRAFGPGEGGLLWRTGNEAIQEARREIVAYREDLSNPPA